ncbi:hypothetical protein [Comamonas terrae]|uniref:DUF3592 domain-containing protein n=1 Tax=Comamonas terrae TaxID=673548 RepID=A0ABW5UPU2_9BURK|nr:hypothetical protein [Comamonas terrae]
MSPLDDIHANRTGKPKMSRRQKWLACAFLLAMLGAVVPVMVNRSFVPSASWQARALYLSIALLAISGVLLRNWHRRGLWQPGPPWPAYGPVRRGMMLLLCLGFMLFIFWLNLAATLPMAYTAVLGKREVREAMVEAKRGSGRRSCAHQLKVQGVNYLFFEFCIDADDYDALPSGPLPARLLVRQSYFGELIGSLHLSVPAPPGAAG